MKIKKVLLSEIKGSVYQPRSQPDLELKNLVNSIIENGLITPIIVRETEKGLCKIICGNRRYEALKIIEENRHPTSLPQGAASVLKDGKLLLECLVFPASITSEDSSIDTLVDNIERLNLTPLERARCYKDMIERLKISQRKLSKRLSIDHAVITRFIKILQLPAEIREALDKRLISFRHIFIIMRLKDEKRQMLLFKKIIKKHLSLPDAEFWCARLLRDEEVLPEDRQFDTMEEELMEHKTISSWIDNKKMRMIKSKEGERIIFNVASVDEFIEIVGIIQKILE